jgi:tetratricopeptide (TPR) repeat protein
MTARSVAQLAAAIAVLVYLPSLAGGFLYDDHRVVLNNRALGSGSLTAILLAEPARPLLGLSWALSHAVSGFEPWSYHLVNVLLHGTNAALLAGLFAWMARRAGSPAPERVALVGACLFAASPLAAETAGYVASRSTALATSFVLASLRVVVGLFDAPSRRRQAVALGLLLLGLASKEEAAALPLLLLLLDYFLVADQRGRAVLSRARLHGPFLALPMLGLLARAVATDAWLPEPESPRSAFLATQLAVFPAYLLRALAPLDPAFYRGQPAVGWPPQLWAVGGFLGAAACAGLAVAGRRRWPLAALAVAWMAACLAPSSSIQPLKEMVVDHRAYLGSAGVVFAFAAALVRTGRTALLAPLLALWALVAVRYQWVLGDPVRAWQDAVRRAPHASEAWRALGDARATCGDPLAEDAYRRAVALAPRDPAVWTNLGAYLIQARRLSEAAEALRRASNLVPRDARIHDNLAMVLAALGRDEEAALHLEAAVAGVPVLAQPRIALAERLVRRGEAARARALLEEAARLPLDAIEEDRLYRTYQLLPPPTGAR